MAILSCEKKNKGQAQGPHYINIDPFDCTPHGELGVWYAVETMKRYVYFITSNLCNFRDMFIPEE